MKSFRLVKILYTYLTKFYMYYFTVFLCAVLGVVGLFEGLDFVQKYLAHMGNDPLIIIYRSIRHVFQFFPYLLFAIFAYTMRVILQKHTFITLQYLGFGQGIWLKLGVFLVSTFFILFYLQNLISRGIYLSVGVSWFFYLFF